MVHTSICSPRIALIVPCYNEAASIKAVDRGFKKALPQIECYVFDNNSTDGTAQAARSAGAQVRHVRLKGKGKGNVVRRMFADVDADIHVMVDGDATYDAAAAPTLIKTLVDGDLDIEVGSRVSNEVAAYRPGHRFRNNMLTGFVSLIFGRAFDDMLSVYRVFSRRFAKSFPAHSQGFDTETELAVHALELRIPVAEVPTVYGARLDGSVSKLNTYRDGFRILLTIFKPFKAEKLLAFCSLGFLLCLLLALGLAAPLVLTYLDTGLVPRLPTAVLCACLVLLGFLFLVCGLVLDTVTLGRLEIKRMAYLQTHAVGQFQGNPPVSE
jgi:glycosyltransferase involved in cell wall biosynthesis